MDNGRHNEAIACEVKEAMRALLKHFEVGCLGCFVTEEVCTFYMTTKYMEASKASFQAQARSGPGVYPPCSINFI